MLADLFNRAAEVIEEHGHHKNNYGNPERGYCFFGALSCAVEGRLLSDEKDVYEGQLDDLYKDQRAQAAVRSATGVHWTSVARWNDAPERTPQEVVTALRFAAFAVGVLDAAEPADA